jgi:hypothetical protein
MGSVSSSSLNLKSNMDQRITEPCIGAVTDNHIRYLSPISAIASRVFSIIRSPELVYSYLKFNEKRANGFECGDKRRRKNNCQYQQ